MAGSRSTGKKHASAASSPARALHAALDGAQAMNATVIVCPLGSRPGSPSNERQTREENKDRREETHKQGKSKHMEVRVTTIGERRNQLAHGRFFMREILVREC